MIDLQNCDCMELLASLPDKGIDLAIVDPPYGIGIAKHEVLGKAKYKKHTKKKWDNYIPTKEYFSELVRVSKNQIIWGGNYFTEFLPPTGAYIFWDKQQPDAFNFTFSQGELAWTSFNKPLKKVKVKKSDMQNCVSNNLAISLSNQKIHPTQKPVALYKWLLKNYAKEGDKILDTHGGSMSSAIACYDYGFDLLLCELDKEYFDAGIKRFETHKLQQKLL